MADASVSVKVLQNAVSSKFGFKPNYREVWMGKQKAIAQIYGDWEESYNHIPRWITGDQVYMPGTIAIEKNLHASRNMRVDLYDRENSEFVVEELAPTGGRIAMSVCRCYDTLPKWHMERMFSGRHRSTKVLISGSSSLN
ncbi:hypothetical protein AHAS_Ahas11G0056000 [Arachis hypogaea]